MYNIVSTIVYSLVQFILNLISFVMNSIFKLVDCVGLSNAENDGFFGVIKGDFIAEVFPSLNSFFNDFVSIGYFIAFVLFVFSLLMILFPYSDFDPPADNPFQLVFRFALAILMVFGFEKFFMTVIYNQLFVPMFDYFNQRLGVGNNAVKWYTDVLVGSYQAGFTNDIGQVVNLVLVIIFGLMFVVQAFKFTIYHYEKLFMTRLLMYFSPIVCGTLATKKSSAIFKNYFNMLLINCISLVMNVFICGLILSGLLHLNSAAVKETINGIKYNGDFFLTGTKTFIVGLMLLTAALKVGKKMSVYISQLFNMNGMSDAVRDGLGMIGMIGGYAGHMVSQKMMRDSMNKSKESQLKEQKEQAAELKNTMDGIKSSLGNLDDALSGYSYTQGYNKAQEDKAVDDAMEKSGLNNIKSIDLDESTDEPTTTDKSSGADIKPGSPENYRNQFDEKDGKDGNNSKNAQSDGGVTDTTNNHLSADKNNSDKSNPDDKNAQKNSNSATDTNTNIPAADTNKSASSNGNDNSDKSNNADNSNNSADIQNQDGKSTDIPKNQMNNENNNPENNNSPDKKDKNSDPANIENSQIQNNRDGEKGTDIDNSNIQNGSVGKSTENANVNVDNASKVEGSDIKNDGNNSTNNNNASNKVGANTSNIENKSSNNTANSVNAHSTNEVSNKNSVDSHTTNGISNNSNVNNSRSSHTSSGSSANNIDNSHKNTHSSNGGSNVQNGNIGGTNTNSVSANNSSNSTSTNNMNSSNVNNRMSHNSQNNSNVGSSNASSGNSDTNSHFGGGTPTNI